MVVSHATTTMIARTTSAAMTQPATIPAFFLVTFMGFSNTGGGNRSVLVEALQSCKGHFLGENNQDDSSRGEA
jgi:hypothetical protein